MTDTTQTTDPIVLRFARLEDGTLVAIRGGVAAIVHPPTSLGPDGGRLPVGKYLVRWSLAGDGIPAEHPRGVGTSRTQSCAEAADALGAHLGVQVAGYEVAT